MFKATLKIKDLHADEAMSTYVGEGETIFDALSNIPRKWNEIKTKGVIGVTDGTPQTQKLFYLKHLRMLFANHLRRKGWAMQLEDLLK